MTYGRRYPVAKTTDRRAGTIAAIHGKSYSFDKTKRGLISLSIFLVVAPSTKRPIFLITQNAVLYFVRLFKRSPTVTKSANHLITQSAFLSFTGLFKQLPAVTKNPISLITQNAFYHVRPFLRLPSATERPATMTVQNTSFICRLRLPTPSFLCPFCSTFLQRTRSSRIYRIFPQPFPKPRRRTLLLKLCRPPSRSCRP